MINRVVLVGRLTRDAELKRSASGSSIATFTIAVDNRQKNPDGTRGTTFLPCVCFQQSADNLVRFTRKGALVGIEGRLNQRNYQRQDGTNGKVIEILCDSVQFLEPKQDNGNQDDAPTFDDQPLEDTNKNLDGIDLPDDDLPF